jgi:hypothetical protein
MTGCAVSQDLPSTPTERVLFVKAQTQAAELRAAGLIRSTERADVEQIDKGTLLSCSGGMQWSGNTRVALRGGAIASAILDQMEDAGSGDRGQRERQHR